MTTVTPEETEAAGSPQPGRRRAFVAATASFVAVFAAGATPIPLYGRFRVADGLTDAELASVAVVYFVCAIGSLFVLGRLSDHLGRKPVTLAALLIAFAGCVVLASVHSVAPLALGRALQGIAAGVAGSAMGAWAVDTAPARPGWLASAVTGSGTNVGLTIGALGAGALVDLAPWPRSLCFAVAGALLIGCGILATIAPDSVRRRPGTLASLRPRIRLPRAAIALLPSAAAIFVATWAIGGYYQAFGPSVAVDYLGSSSALVSGAVFASWLAPSAFGAPIAARLSVAGGQRLSALLVAGAVAGLALALGLGSVGLFLAAGVVGSVGMGIGMTASIRGLLGAVGAGERAGTLGLVYAICYAGAAVPSLVAGQVSRILPLYDVTLGYVALAVLALALVLALAHPISKESLE